MRITVPLRRLDSLASELDLLRPGETPLLKIDTEGYELEVLRGAERLLATVQAVEAELLLIPIFGGQRRFEEIIHYLEHKGFALTNLEPGYFDWERGQLHVADGLFLRVGSTTTHGADPRVPQRQPRRSA